jgi:dipeptidyl aminopeptidase/acylaminoacyl peptidase
MTARVRRPALRVIASLALAACGLQGLTVSEAAEPYPLEYFALRDVISNVRVSPNGKVLALMKIPTRDGNPVIEVYDAGDLAREPFRVSADPMEITSFDWVSETNFVMSLRQKVRDRIEGFNQGVYDTRIAKVDVEREKIEAFDELNATISNVLPNKPNKVILSFNPSGDRSSKIAEQFRPRAYYEFDVERGTKRLILQGQVALAQIEFDANGNPWTARGFDPGKGEFIWYVRKPGESEWEEIYRQSEDSFEVFEIEGFDEAQRNILFVRANNGHDIQGLWEFDTNTNSFGPLIYRRPDVDVIGVRFHSNTWTNYDTVAAVAYAAEKIHFEYFDGVEEATYRQLEELVPNSHYVRIVSRSRDGETLVVENSGPRDPGTFYLLKDGRLQLVGSKQPLFKADDLADVEYITYEARDGRQIPAYLTIPNGEPPFPAIVLPHGGPFVQEIVGYDEWGQVLANNGYLVLQPQYRGSHGYGLDFYTSAFRDGGQGGFKMQDDKDDGALYLVEQGLADRDRLALFGWSYGGYAALVAASRTPQIYQCVVAGAAVSDPIMQVNYYRDFLRGAQRDEQLNMWRDSISPVKDIGKVNVPMLLIHGDVDQRVPPAHVRKYMKELDQAGKDYRYVELKGADHFSNTLFYEHQIMLYESLIGYLKDDCGPAGL